MAALLALLTAFALAPLFASASEGGLCLACHPAHYEKAGPCVRCHRGNDRTRRVDVAHHDLIPGRFAAFRVAGHPKVEQGRRLAEGLACRRCHVMEGKGNPLAADLDSSLSTSTPGELVSALRKPALSMPDFRLATAQIDGVVTYLLFAWATTAPGEADRPVAVHFDGGGRQEENVFVKSCGGCHRALTPRHGGLGTGDVGPNLSGLLTRFYPASFLGKESWSRENLKRWLENPRRVRSGALMQPVLLEARDLQALFETVGGPDPKGGAVVSDGGRRSRRRLPTLPPP